MIGKVLNVLKKTSNTALIAGVLIMLFGQYSQAQSLGDPIVNITFGSGTATHAGALSADSGATSYTYSSADFPNDGSYTIENTTNTPGTWWTTTDHTGNSGGYMMVVNASVSKTDYFYKRTVTGLCGATSYQFSAWVGNLLKTQDISPPNITFSILNTDGTVIQSYNTGQIALNTSGFKWVQQTFNFTLPAGTTTVIIQMTNNANGGAPANDLALDDITFRPYGSQISAVYDQSSNTTATTCAGTSKTVTIDATTTLATGYVQKLQMLVNGVWTDLSAASTQTSFTVTSPTSAGTYYYRLASALAANVSSAQCVVGSNQLSLTVSPGAAAAFTVADTTCLGSPTVFTDATVSSGGGTLTYLWDFGDGQTSATPTHTYAAAGDYTVNLTVTNSSGCSSTATSKKIHISTPPIAKFAVSATDCATQAITFTDQSTAGEGSLKSWLWDFGDGSATESTQTPQPHQFAAAGIYTVTLAVTNNKGSCANSIPQSVTVYPVPVVNFGLPSVCQTDFYANFTDSTTIADKTNLTYSWNFGDGNANAAYPNTSTDQNPKHHYTSQGTYTITLTVTSAHSCSVTKTKTLTVNGAVPVANFNVLNSLTKAQVTTVCTNQEVLIQNTSTVDFGNITKVKIYFDYGNDTTISVTDYSPYNGKIYRYKYPEFHTPASKTVTVYMVANSGNSCGAVTSRTVTLLATPSVTFSPISAICSNVAPVQLVVTPGASAVTATGVFSGTGISSTGLFDPGISGVGTFPIQYIYTSTNTCADTVTQNIRVNSTPTVNAGADFSVLQGASAKMKATAKGDTLTYTWTPATGLSSTTVLDPVITPKADITYTLTVTTPQGCSASSSVTVTIIKVPIIPNTFTPNGDSINDTWDIKYLDQYTTASVQIFSRNGQRVFWSTGYPKPWDGTYNGSQLPIGVYYYVINPNNGLAVMSGSVTIIR